MQAPLHTNSNAVFRPHGLPSSMAPATSWNPSLNQQRAPSGVQILEHHTSTRIDNEEIHIAGDSYLPSTLMSPFPWKSKIWKSNVAAGNVALTYPSTTCGYSRQLPLWSLIAKGGKEAASDVGNRHRKSPHSRQLSGAQQKPSQQFLPVRQNGGPKAKWSTRAG